MNEEIIRISPPKMPRIAVIPASGPTRSIPSRGVMIRRKKRNQIRLNARPFLRVYRDGFFLFSSANWGRYPPCANTLETIPSGKPHREQNLESVLISNPHDGQNALVFEDTSIGAVDRFRLTTVSGSASFSKSALPSFRQNP